MSSYENWRRIKTTLAGGVPDALGISELVYWPETIERWHQEGLPQDQEPGEYFGTDAFGLVSPDLTLGLEKQIVVEDDRAVVEMDTNGVYQKQLKGSYSPPAPVDYTVKDRDSWLRFRARLAAEDWRIPADLDKVYHEHRAKNRFIVFKNPEPCWASIKILGTENVLIAMAENPAWIHEMFEAYTQLIIELYERMAARGFTFDGAWLNGDLCYRNGMLFSPRMYRSLLLPYHGHLCRYFHHQGLPVITHVCGDARQLIPLYLEAGFDAIQPLEARAGNDVRELKRKYGTTAVFIGNINCDVLGRSREEIKEEIESKLSVAKVGGGYVFHSDHSVPPTVSFANYSYALELVDRYGRA
jgi:uroporphyrinogen decarboxylase